MPSVLISGFGLYLITAGVATMAIVLLRSFMGLYMFAIGLLLSTLGLWVLYQELKSPTELREEMALTAQEVREWNT